MKWKQRALADCASFFSGGTPNKGKPECVFRPNVTADFGIVTGDFGRT